MGGKVGNSSIRKERIKVQSISDFFLSLVFKKAITKGRVMNMAKETDGLEKKIIWSS